MTFFPYRAACCLSFSLFLMAVAGCDIQRMPRDTDGEGIYRAQCASCHQMDGMGLPGLYPPLVGTQWVTGSEERLVRVILHGLTGTIMVRGETYRGAMPGHQHLMDAAQVAEVVNYIRNTWGNDADSVSVETVEGIQQTEEGRRRPWTEEELAPWNGW